MTDLSAWIVDNDWVKGTYLCGFLSTGTPATSADALAGQHGIRLWSHRQSVVPERFQKPKTTLIHKAGIPYLVTRTDFMNKMDASRLAAVKTLISEENAVYLQSCYDKFFAKAAPSANRTIDMLFRSHKAALSWESTDGVSETNLRLVVNPSALINKDLSGFGTSKTHAAHLVRQVIEKDIFQRRFALLRARFAAKCPGVPPPLITGTKMDLVAFHLFVRSCPGPISDLAAVDDSLTGAFIGLGDLGVAARILEEVSHSSATEEERRSFGVTPETDAAALQDIKNTIAGIEQNIQDVRADVAVLQVNAIPEEDRLFPSAFLHEQNFQTPEGVSFGAVCKALGSLVTKAISKDNLRDTIAKEPTEYGFRNVYRRSIHEKYFQSSFEAFPDAIQELLEQSVSFGQELLGQSGPTSFGSSPGADFDAFLLRMSSEDRDFYFKDVGDTALADATTELQRTEILSKRITAARFVYIAHRRALDGGLVTKTPLQVFMDSMTAYLQRREEKHAKAVAKAATRSAAKAKTRAAKKAAPKAAFLQTPDNLWSRSRSRSPR